MAFYFFSYDRKYAEIIILTVNTIVVKGGIRGMTAFSLYGAIHIGWLIVIAFITLISASYYTVASPDVRRKYRIALPIVLIVLEIIKQLLFFLHGTFTLQKLPLHLCDIATFLILWHALRPTSLNKEILYAIVLPGSLAALLFPSWNEVAIFSYSHIHGFVQHALLIIYPIWLLLSGELKPNPRELHRVAIFLIGLALPIYLFNKTFDVNFMFTNYPAPGSPLVILEEWLGNPGYLVGFVGLILIVWFFMYLPFDKTNKD